MVASLKIARAQRHPWAMRVHHAVGRVKDRLGGQYYCPMCEKKETFERALRSIHRRLAKDSLSKKDRRKWEARHNLLYGLYVQLPRHPKCASCGVNVGEGHIDNEPIEACGKLWCLDCAMRLAKYRPDELTEAEFEIIMQRGDG